MQADTVTFSWLKEKKNNCIFGHVHDQCRALNVCGHITFALAIYCLCYPHYRGLIWISDKNEGKKLVSFFFS